MTLSAGVYVHTRTLADPDLWGHIVFGERIWQTWKVAQPDIYSYVMPGRIWSNHEWLIDVVFYAVFRTFGPTGLVIMKLAVIALILGLLYRHFERRALTQPVASVLLIIMVVAMTPSLSTVRAQLATLLGFLVTLLVIHASTIGHPRRLWMLPPVFAVWANLHGGFLAGLGIVLIWATVELGALWWKATPDGRAAKVLTIAGPVAVSALAVCLNPFGVELLTFLYRTALVARPEISEWRSITIASDWGFIYVTLVSLALVGLIGGRSRPQPALLAVLLTSFVAAGLAGRHLALAALAVSVLACEGIDDAWIRLSGHRAVGCPRLLRIACAGLAIILLLFGARRVSCIEFVPGARPVRAIALLKESGVQGNLAVDFDWGTYAAAQLTPRIRVSVDGRRETLYDGKEYRDNLNFMFGHEEWNALLTRYDTHLALVSKQRPGFNLMKLEPGWSLVYEDPLSGLFVKNGLPILETLRRTTAPPLPYDGSGLCFP